MRLKPISALVVLLLAAAFWPVPQASACSCLPPTLSQLQDQSDVIFRGTVTSNTSASALNRTVTFDVTTLWQGEFPGEDITITTPRDSAGCGIEFEVGREYTVAAADYGDGLSSNLCSLSIKQGYTYVSLEEAMEDQEPLTSNECAPYVCNDGTTHPSCSEDGHQIMYFAPPCLTHGGDATGSSASSSSRGST